MASTSATGKSVTHGFDAKRKSRIVIGACGSVAAMKFGLVCRAFMEWEEVHAIVTKPSCHFIAEASIPKGVTVFRDEHEWQAWKQLGDTAAHIKLANWADIFLIAPLSAHTLAKISGGLCDNLLTSIVRSWDYKKPMFVAPSMNDAMWRNPLTEQHLKRIDELGITVIPPHESSDGEYTNIGAMADPSKIYSTVRVFYDSNILKKKPGVVYCR